MSNTGSPVCFVHSHPVHKNKIAGGMRRAFHMLKHDLEDPEHLVLFVFRNEERMVLCGLLKLFH